jgi:hypothetical protein
LLYFLFLEWLILFLFGCHQHGVMMHFPRTLLDVESLGIAISLCFKLAHLARTLVACFTYLPRLESFLWTLDTRAFGQSFGVSHNFTLNIIWGVDAPGNQLLRSWLWSFRWKLEKLVSRHFGSCDIPYFAEPKLNRKHKHVVH